MSELVAIAYPEEQRAQEVMQSVLERREVLALDVEDAASVSKDKNEKIKLHQSAHLGRKGAATGGTIGLIAGVLFLNPVVGAGVGALVGGVANRLRDVGISDEFVRQVSAQLRPESSVLVLLLPSGDLPALHHELAREGAVVLHTSLAADAETQLQAALDAQLSAPSEQPSAESANGTGAV